MKKSILLLAAITMITFTSCKDKTEEGTDKTVVIEKTTETQVVAQDTTEADGTSISVNKEGVEFSSKDGEKNTSVEVDENGAAISTKK
jgi:hypothetical protein